MRLRNTFGAVALVGLLAGCGAAAPTQQLVDARHAYDAAANGAAARYTPAQLLEAQEALNRAEEAHSSDPGSEWEAHYAYIAERQARLAIAAAVLTQARAENQALQQAAQTAAQRQLRDASGELQQLRAKQEQFGQLAGELDAVRQERRRAEELANQALQSLRDAGQVRDEGTVITITVPGGVLFATGEHQLLPLSRKQLNQVAEALRAQPGDRRVVVEGHTDSVGSAENNQELSERRAESVRDYLVQQGVEGDRIEVRGRGQDSPIADNETPAGRAMNRRVEIIIHRQAEEGPGQQQPGQLQPGTQQQPGMQQPGQQQQPGMQQPGQQQQPGMQQTR